MTKTIQIDEQLLSELLIKLEDLSHIAEALNCQVEVWAASTNSMQAFTEVDCGPANGAAWTARTLVQQAAETLMVAESIGQVGLAMAG